MLTSTMTFLNRPLTASLKTKYNNNHNEIKQVLAQNEKFNTTNWTHYTLFIQLVVNAIITIVSLNHVMTTIVG